MKPWFARVWREAPGCWQWDVRVNGSRSTGDKSTWRAAYDSALAELAYLSRR